MADENNIINDVTAPPKPNINDGATKIDVTTNSSPASASEPTASNSSSVDLGSASLEQSAETSGDLSTNDAMPTDSSDENAVNKATESSDKDVLESADYEPSKPEPSQPEPSKPDPVTTETPVEAPKVISSDSVKTAKSGGSMIHLVVEVILVLAIAGLGYYAMQLNTKNSDLQQQVNILKDNPAIKAQKETADTVKAVSKLTALPTGEEPQLYKINNPQVAAKQQTFFTNSKSGDILLVYINANKAILYRPSTNKIVTVGPINLSATNAANGTKTTTKTTTTKSTTVNSTTPTPIPVPNSNAIPNPTPSSR